LVSLHVLTSITQSHAMEQIGILKKLICAAPEHNLARICDAMANTPSR